MLTEITKIGLKKEEKANLTDNVPKMYDCISNITETNHLIFLREKKTHSVVEVKRQKRSRETRLEPSS